MDNEYIFTFGFGQGHDNGFVSINARNSTEARNRMVEMYGVKWGFQYDCPDARDKAGVDKFNLVEVK